MPGSGKSASLKDLAQDWLKQRKLYGLFATELTLLHNLETGKPFDGRNVDSVRAELIRFLCGNTQAQNLVDPCGIFIERTQILGEEVDLYIAALNLRSIKIPFPLIFHRCKLPPWLLLQGVEIPFLDLDGSEVGSIGADVLKVRGDLYLRNGFKSRGILNFSGATVGGDFDCSGATFEYQRPTISHGEPRQRHLAMNAEGIHVSGDMRMTNWPIDTAPVPFLSTGKICLDGAHIEGDLLCDGGTFINRAIPGDLDAGDALTLRHATIGGDVFFGRHFSSEGAVRLPGATIGGNLNCAGGLFSNPWKSDKRQSGVALEVDGTAIKLNVDLSHAFSADGTVSFVGTRIGLALNCRGGTFKNSDRPSPPPADTPPPTSAPHRWRPALDLTNAGVSYLHYPSAARNPGSIHKDQLILDGFVYDRIGTAKWKEYLDWIDLQFRKSPTDLPSQPYLQLAKVLREKGDLVGSKRILYEMEKLRPLSSCGPAEQPGTVDNTQPQTMRRKTSRRWCRFKRSLSRLWKFLKRITIGYGYYPTQAFYGLVILCFFGFAIYSMGKHHVAPTHADAFNIFIANRKSLPGGYIGFNPFLYSIENSLPLVKFGQSEYWQPMPHPLSGNDWRSWFCWAFSPDNLLGAFRALQIAAGWFLTTMGVAGLTGIIRKD